MFFPDNIFISHIAMIRDATEAMTFESVVKNLKDSYPYSISVPVFPQKYEITIPVVVRNTTELMIREIIVFVLDISTLPLFKTNKIFLYISTLYIHNKLYL